MTFRSIALAGVAIALIGCAERPHRMVRPQEDSANIRAVMGRQAMTSVPLTPEPGDVWSDLAFLRQPGSTPAADPTLEHPTTAAPATVATTAAAVMPPRPASPPPRASTVHASASSETPAPQPAPIPEAAPVAAPVATPAVSAPVAPSTATPPSSRGFAVQLAAAPTEAAALREWEQLQRRMPDVLGTHTPSVVSAEVDGRQLWRLRTGGFATRADATAFCSQVQSLRGSCWVITGMS